MKELTDWVEKNSHRTWNFVGGTDKLTLEIKYLEFSLDTRDMTVWRLGASGRGPEVSIRDTRDDGDWTILNELEKRLDAASQTPDAASGVKNE